MKHVKLLLAFAVGVVLTLAITDNLPGLISFHLPKFPHILASVEAGVDDVFALLILIIVAAFFWKKKTTPVFSATPQGAFERFCQSLRTLKRSRTDLWLGGVCGGLGEQTSVPAWAWRLGFALALTYYGTGILTYILLWVFLPENNGAEAVDSNASPHQRNDFFDFLRHYRLSTRDCQIGCVCGGLGEQTAVPAWVWRIGFTALMLCYGVGLVPYVLLWIFVPNADAAANAESKSHQQSPA